MVQNMSQTEVQTMYSQLNGVLFTGGELDLVLTHPYVQTAKAFFDLATHDKSDVFTIWGTCQGFQVCASTITWDLCRQ